MNHSGALRRAAMLCMALLALSLCAVFSTFAWLGLPNTQPAPVQSGVMLQYFERGDGSSGNPFIIHTPRHLYNMAWLQDLGKFDGKTYYFQLCNGTDCTHSPAGIPNSGLDMTGYVLPPIGTDSHPFTGVFEGNYRTIKNLTVSSSGPWTTPPDASSFPSGWSVGSNIGFFGKVVGADSSDPSTPSSNGIIRNFNLTNITVNTQVGGTVGLIAGTVDGTAYGIGVCEADGRKSQITIGGSPASSDFSLIGKVDSDVYWSDKPTGGGSGDLVVIPSANTASTSGEVALKTIDGVVVASSVAYVPNQSMKPQRQDVVLLNDSVADSAIIFDENKGNNHPLLISPGNNAHSPLEDKSEDEIVTDFWTVYNSDYTGLQPTSAPVFNYNTANAKPTNSIWFKPTSSGECTVAFAVTSWGGSKTANMSIYRFLRDDSGRIIESSVKEEVFELSKNAGIGNGQIVVFQFPVTFDENSAYEYAIGKDSYNTGSTAAFMFLKLAGSSTGEHTSNLVGKKIEHIDFMAPGAESSIWSESYKTHVNYISIEEASGKTIAYSATADSVNFVVTSGAAGGVSLHATIDNFGTPPPPAPEIVPVTGYAAVSAAFVGESAEVHQPAKALTIDTALDVYSQALTLHGAPNWSSYVDCSVYEAPVAQDTPLIYLQNSPGTLHQSSLAITYSVPSGGSSEIAFAKWDGTALPDYLLSGASLQTEDGIHYTLTIPTTQENIRQLMFCTVDAMGTIQPDIPASAGDFSAPEVQEIITDDILLDDFEAGASDGSAFIVIPTTRGGAVTLESISVIGANEPLGMIEYRMAGGYVAESDMSIYYTQDPGEALRVKFIQEEDSMTIVTDQPDRMMVYSAVPYEITDQEPEILSAEATEPTEETTPEESTEPTEEIIPEESTEPTEETIPEESTGPTEETIPEESTEPAEETIPEETTTPPEEVIPEETTQPAEEPTEETEPEEPEVLTPNYFSRVQASFGGSQFWVVSAATWLRGGFTADVYENGILMNAGAQPNAPVGTYFQAVAPGYTAPVIRLEHLPLNLNAGTMTILYRADQAELLGFQLGGGRTVGVLELEGAVVQPTGDGRFSARIPTTAENVSRMAFCKLDGSNLVTDGEAASFLILPAALGGTVSIDTITLDFLNESIGEIYVQTSDGQTVYRSAHIYCVQEINTGISMTLTFTDRLTVETDSAENLWVDSYLTCEIIDTTPPQETEAPTEPVTEEVPDATESTEEATEPEQTEPSAPAETEPTESSERAEEPTAPTEETVETEPTTEEASTAPTKATVPEETIPETITPDETEPAA